jgi:hypothetical protein
MPTKGTVQFKEYVYRKRKDEVGKSTGVELPELI